MRARVLLAGAAEGAVLRLDEPLSLWGGVDAASSRLIDPRSPQAGEAIAGRVLMLAAAVGSSSSAAILLELLARGLQPAAIVLGRADAIVALGVIVAREMGYPVVPVLELAPERQRAFANGSRVRIAADGAIEPAEG